MIFYYWKNSKIPKVLLETFVSYESYKRYKSTYIFGINGLTKKSTSCGELIYFIRSDCFLKGLCEWDDWGQNHIFFLKIEPCKNDQDCQVLVAEKNPKLCFNPFLPTSFLPPIIILMKCLMFYFSKCCFNVSLCRTRCEFGIAIMFRSSKF